MKAAFKDSKGETRQLPVMFDRCVRVELCSSRQGSSPKIILEYKPRFSRKKTNTETEIPLGSLCTRIDCKVLDLPKTNNRNKTPGFSATIKIYNDDGSLARVLASNVFSTTDFLPKGVTSPTNAQKVNAYRKYQQNKLWAIIKVGYWNEDKGDADYKQVFAGIINSNTSYRRGVDLITEIYASDVMVDQLSTDQINLAFDTGPKTVATFNPDITGYKEDETISQPVVSATNTWELLLKQIITDYSVYKSRGNGGILSIFSRKSQSSSAPEIVTDEDRKTTGWFSIKYRNDSLAEKARAQDPTERVKNFYASTSSFEVLMADVMAIFPGASVGYSISDDPEANGGKGCRTYWIYQNEKRGIKLPEDKRPTHTVYDYQNLLSTPMLGTTSGLVVNMLLNPEIHANEYFKLALSEDAKANLGTSVGLSSEQLGQFTTALQGGYSQVVKAQTKSSNGSVFNRAFLIQQVIHEFSTHGNTWKTQVTTVPKISTNGE